MGDLEKKVAQQHWLFDPFGDDQEKIEKEDLLEQEARKKALKSISDSFNKKDTMDK